MDTAVISVAAVMSGEVVTKDTQPGNELLVIGSVIAFSNSAS
jgi:hypothetical protein